MGFTAFKSERMNGKLVVSPLGEFNLDFLIPYNVYTLRRSKSPLGLFGQMAHEFTTPDDTRILVDAHDSNLYWGDRNLHDYYGGFSSGLELVLHMRDDFVDNPIPAIFDDFAQDIVVIRFKSPRDATYFKMSVM